MGAVASISGNVVDIQFDAHLPAICSSLHAKDEIIAITGATLQNKTGNWRAGWYGHKSLY
jgi:F0F1-type ATP synthase beta subunit